MSNSPKRPLYRFCRRRDSVFASGLRSTARASVVTQKLKGSDEIWLPGWFRFFQAHKFYRIDAITSGVEAYGKRPDPCPPGNTPADRVDDSGDFVSRDPWVLDSRPHPFLYESIAVADATSLYFYTHLSSARLFDLQFNEFKGTTGTSDLHCPHF